MVKSQAMAVALRHLEVPLSRLAQVICGHEYGASSGALGSRASESQDFQEAPS